MMEDLVLSRFFLARFRLSPTTESLEQPTFHATTTSVNSMCRTHAQVTHAL